MAIDRCAVDIDTDADRSSHTRRAVAPAERRRQVQQLLAAFERDRTLPTVFMGDVNEWFLIGRPLRWLHRHFESAPAPASFPARLPVLALDRIWVKPRHMLLSIARHDTALARQASDHLPVVARIAALPAAVAPE